MDENLVCEFSRQIKTRIIYGLSLLLISFITMILVYENFFKSANSIRLYIHDLFNLLPFLLYLPLKERFFRYNWAVKIYLCISLIFFHLYLFTLGRQGMHSLFPILYPLCTVMYLKDRKGLFLSFYLLTAVVVTINRSILYPEYAGLFGFAGLQLLNSFIILLLALTIDRNIKRIGEKVRFIQYADHKTNLPNRDRFIGDMYGSSERRMVAILNIDGFKYINDLHGHYIGDELLIVMGRTLCRSFPDWHIYRLSGSEFALVSRIEGVLEEKQNELKSFVSANSSMQLTIAGIELQVGISIGAAVEGEEGTDRKSILVHTDIALQDAKELRSKIYFYKKDNPARLKMSENHQWKHKIMEAFKFDRFCSYYQPILCNKTGVVKKYECLARFVDTDGMVHSPQVFMPYLNSTRYYSKLTRTMVNKGFNMLQNSIYDLSINLSVEDLYDPFTIQYILLMLENNHHLAHRIQFEILESAPLGDLDRARAIIDDLKRFSCRIALDDFGSGYSNFEYLTRLNIDCIKIDGSLIQKICEDDSAYSMVKNIVHFCKDLGVEIIAEFVSDRDIYNRVMELGIDYSQGYYIGKPVDQESLTASAGDPEQLIRFLQA